MHWWTVSPLQDRTPQGSGQHRPTAASSCPAQNWPQWEHGPKGVGCWQPRALEDAALHAGEPSAWGCWSTCGFYRYCSYSSATKTEWFRGKTTQKKPPNPTKPNENHQRTQAPKIQTKTKPRLSFKLMHSTQVCVAPTGRKLVVNILLLKKI